MMHLHPLNDLVVYFLERKILFITLNKNYNVLLTLSITSSCPYIRSVLSQPTSYRPRLLLEGRPGSGQNSHLAPAVLHALEKFTVYTLDIAVLFGTSATAPEETCAQVFMFMH